MDSVIGSADFFRMIVALIFVLSLILLGLFLVRKYGKGWGFQHTPSRNRRLQIIETLPIGPRQRLMLVMRDHTEHLLVVNQEKTTVIEKNIQYKNSQPPQTSTNSEMPTNHETTVSRHKASEA